METLEILVRNGHYKGAEKYCENHALPEPTRKEKFAEALVYHTILCMNEEAEGGIEPRRAEGVFSLPEVKPFLSATRNAKMLSDLIDVLEAGTHASMEAYALITAVDVLKIEPVIQALENNLSDSTLKEKVVNLVNRGYSLVFCPHDITSEMVESYFPIVDKWRALIEPEKVAEQAVKNFDDLDGLMEYDYSREFLKSALKHLERLVGRPFLSETVREQYGESKAYKTLCGEGLIDSVVPNKKSEKPTPFALVLEKYEREHLPEYFKLEELARVMSEKERETLAERMGIWLQKGMFEHLQNVLEQKPALYDAGKAKHSLAKALASLTEQGKYHYLGHALLLPAEVIDFESPELKSFVEAYKINQETKSKESPIESSY